MHIGIAVFCCQAFNDNDNFAEICHNTSGTICTDAFVLLHIIFFVRSKNELQKVLLAMASNY